MAEGGLSAPAPQWIILPPSLEREAWRVAIMDHAEKTGVDVQEWREGSSVSPTATLIMTEDIREAQSAGASDQDIIVVGLKPFVDLEGCHEDSDVNARVDVVSRKIAAAYGFKGRLIRDLTNHATIPALPGFSGASVKPFRLREPSAREIALQNAFETFRSGRGDWSSRLFSYDARNAGTGPRLGQLDVTGRPRCLLHGPYLVMPAGTWQAVVTLHFDHNVSHRRFRIDWGGGENFTSHEFYPGRSGVFEISLDCTWDVPGPSELRVLILEGVFDGGMSFGGAVISQITDAPPFQGAADASPLPVKTA